MSQRYLIFDWETRSEVDLKRVGSWEYSKHSSTEILCVAWKFGTRIELQRAKIETWSPFINTKNFHDFLNCLDDPEVIKVAHNSLFEKVIMLNVLPKYTKKQHEISHDSWMCTASMAAALALPRSLEGACSALKLPIQKDTIGRKLILKYCKPRKPSLKNPSKWWSKKSDLARILLYCKNDVDAETELFLALPELNENERKVWLLDQKINLRGVKIDREMVDATLEMIDAETKNLNIETVNLTHGVLSSTNQRNSVLKWLHGKGVFLPDLRAKTVKDAIDLNLVTGDARRLLQIRQSLSRTSTAKYTAFEARSRTDGRVRDTLVYHTASTGRWGGAGVQPQNFPRGTIDDTVTAADVLKYRDLEFVRLIFGDPMAVFSSCLRSVITSTEGEKLFCADYAAVEARVLFWVGKHTLGIKAFREDKPMYEEMAQVIFNVDKIENVTKHQRQIGKGVVLGAGYGLGWKKFLTTCQNNGIELDEQVAQTAIAAYRSVHKPVVTLWSNINRAAIEAVKRKGTKFKINYTTWWVAPLPNLNYEFLWCELPSGRRLAYALPEVRYETVWDEKRPVLYHWGLNPVTRLWECSGTYGGRLVENIIQAIARDLLAEAMLRLDNAKYKILLTIHDEALAEKENGSIEEFNNLMSIVPLWAQGAPIKVAGWSGDRYRK